MGYSRKRRGKNGRVRYQGVYQDSRGMDRSAGTFDSKKLAEKAWQRAQAKVDEGRGEYLVRGKQRFKRYVEETWLPNHIMEATTREAYTYSLYAHIMDYFGAMRMRDILPSDVRAWVSKLADEGMQPATIQKNKTILSAIFTAAFADQTTVLHPCKGVKGLTVPGTSLRIITPEEFDTFYAALPNEMFKMLVELAAETGMRWGELVELRPKDFDLNTRLVTVNRVVVELARKFHPDGGRFLVKDYPKDGEPRRFKISKMVAAKIIQYIENFRLAEGDLLFWYDRKTKTPIPHLPDPDTLGYTAPNSAGRRYRHGTPTAYNAGKCGCAHCRTAMAAYRANRRANGKDSPRKQRVWDTDGHVPHRWFRDSVIKPALIKAELSIDIKMHSLRHAHASWLLAGGADLQVVKERLGHDSIRTTEKYLHTLPDADETALEALATTRNRATNSARSSVETSPDVIAKLDELKRLLS